MTRWLDQFFQLSEQKTTVRREVVAGLTTFFTMAYIVAVNPAILKTAGMPLDARLWFTTSLVACRMLARSAGLAGL